MAKKDSFSCSTGSMAGRRAVPGVQDANQARGDRGPQQPLLPEVSKVAVGLRRGVAPASCRLSRGHPALTGVDETPPRSAAGTAALQIRLDRKSGLNSGFQAGNFFERQMPKFSRRNIELQRSVAHALDLLHVMSDRLEHPPDLPVFALDQRDFVPGIVALRESARSWPARSSTRLPSSVCDENSRAQLRQAFSLTACPPLSPRKS